MAEMLVSLALISILAATITPVLMSITPSSNRALLRKAYSTTEKVVFRILEKKDTNKNLIFASGQDLMDTSTSVNIGGKNKFCYYFKEELNTLDISGVDCPASSVTTSVIRFAKTSDGIDWYIAPAPFSNVNFDDVARKTNEEMKEYATQKADEAKSNKTAEIEQYAQDAYTKAYSALYDTPTTVIDQNSNVSSSCTLTKACSCDESQTRYNYYKVTSTIYDPDDTIKILDPSNMWVWETIPDDAIVSLTSQQLSQTEADTFLGTEYGTDVSACGTSTMNYCYRYNSKDEFEDALHDKKNAVYGTTDFVNKYTVAVVATQKMFQFAYSYSLVGVAYPNYTRSGTQGYSKWFNTYGTSDPEILTNVNYLNCPPCKTVTSRSKSQNFCEFEYVKPSLQYYIDDLIAEIKDHIKKLEDANVENQKAAAVAYAEKKEAEARTYWEDFYWQQAYQAAINDTTEFNKRYKANLASSSGTGNAYNDYPLKIIVDVNGVDKQPNCSADASAYGASYMPAGYRNINCSDPDTFIFGIRYDGKIRVANSASSYTATAYTDEFAKEYLSNFIHN